MKNKIRESLKSAFILLDRKAQKELERLNDPARALFSDAIGAPIPKFYYNVE